jgi:hypothetical protein
MNKYVLCVSNKGYELDLVVRKVYEVLAEEHGMIRVVDETDEDYLFEKSLFVPIEVPEEAQGIFTMEPA